MKTLLKSCNIVVAVIAKMIEHLINRIMQLFANEYVDKVLKAIFVLCDKFVNFLLNLFDGNKYNKKDETVDVLYTSNNFLVINKKHDLLINSNDTKKVLKEKNR